MVTSKVTYGGCEVRKTAMEVKIVNKISFEEPGKREQEQKGMRGTEKINT